MSTATPSPVSSPGSSQDTPQHLIQYGQQLSTASPSPIHPTARSSPGPGQEISKLAW